ncbi:hypothetical protein [Trinickia diaoshuihuensis]|uniref:hypothetical protein n=1 Tax=Trinickia diaoshuihuensis TaxID=2292265 RepID=UPI0013C2B2E5|nr:hypothetical protein [Trinickia diaoshuihuensis]
MANGIGSIPSGIVGRMREQLETKIGNGTANPAQAKQSPAMRNPGAQLGGLSSFKASDGGPSLGAGEPRRAGLPGQARNTAAQVAGAALQGASHFMPPGLGIGANVAGNLMMASGSPGSPGDPGDPGDGDETIADHGAQMNSFIRQSKAMAEIDNRTKMAMMLINGQSKAISGLASIGNKGIEDAVNAAKGQ